VLAQLKEALPRIARQKAQPLAQIVDTEVIGAHALRELLPGERRRDRRLLAGACRIGRDRGRAAPVAEIVDQDAPAPQVEGERVEVADVGDQAVLVGRDGAVPRGAGDAAKRKLC